MTIEWIDKTEKQKKYRPMCLEDINFNIVRLLCLNGVVKEPAFIIGQKITEHLAHNWGGRDVYIPRKHVQPDETHLGLMGSKNSGILFLEDINIQIIDYLYLATIDKATAISIAQQITRKLTILFNGEKLFIPMMWHESIAKRRSMIYEEFQGGNGDMVQLGIKYNISTRSVYRIIKEERIRIKEDAKKRVTNHKM